MNSSILKTKNNVRFYWPKTNYDDDLDVEELRIRTLDLIESYVYPLKYGLTINDVADYLDNFSEMSLLDFLRFKSYISVEEDFLNLMRQIYPEQEKIVCYHIVIQDIGNDSIEVLRERFDKCIDSILYNNVSKPEKTTIQIDSLVL